MADIVERLIDENPIMLLNIEARQEIASLRAQLSTAYEAGIVAGMGMAEAELRELIASFVLTEIDYMTRNMLGDPEKQHNVKWARKLGITVTERFWRDGKRTTANGCRSANEPCSWQRTYPNSLCAICAAAVIRAQKSGGADKVKP